ncbi:S-adenosyl-L-methionine-dependent methyltransferase [Rhizodiscina lignyota]|uniref:S-adenosyl-L-methionine-dependent methyltransferase n=1 Tax=Rhizodiscina lignyota TaxID=1504668 RepID=A0A9P4M148_9PEZI|nr:S-adenosyl-L-methionine-dependent methyltransferase [Rhizodiscina lignyota]
MAAALIDEIVKNGQLLRDSNDQTARQKIIAAASSLIEELEIPPEKLARIGWGEPSRTAALRTAFDLGILTKLGEEPMSSAQLAEGTKADPQLVARVMKHLASYGIVKEIGRDQYCGSPFSMASNDPTIRGGLIYSFEGMIPTFHGLPEFLAKTNYQVPTDSNDGPVQYGLRTDRPFFAVLQSNTRLGTAFNNFMQGYAKARPRWVDYYPCEERLGSGSGQGPLLVDVGGGLGHDITAFHSKFPNIPGQLVLEDTPKVIDEAKSSSSSLPPAIKPVPHDFFSPQPMEYRGARAYFLRLVLHDWPDSQCNAILSHLRDAMTPGYSKILINENVLFDEGAPWQQTSLDWTMMGMLVARERTEDQWRELLAAAGLKLNGIWQKDPASESVIEAVLADE